MSTAEITRLSQPIQAILKLSDYRCYSIATYQVQKDGPSQMLLPLALQALYFWLDLSKVTYYLAMIPGTVL